MKIATFNINNVNKRLANLLDWLASAAPDVVCLQELRCERRAFPVDALREAGYAAAWQGERSWNGVAILAKGTEPVIIRTELPGDPSDRQSRYIEGAVSGIVIASIYLPNGNPQPGPKFDYKLAWFKRLIAHAAELRSRTCRWCSQGTSTSCLPTSTSTRRRRGAGTRFCSRRAALLSLGSCR